MATFAAVAALTWRKWADVLVDFGPQLYLPWKISTGSVLERDVMYLPGGPLSVYYHALLFKIFGVSYLTLIISNLGIVAGMLLLIYRRFLAASDPLTATVIGLGIVLVFTFGHYSDTGNYNYISPYAHEVLHGLALSIACLALLSSWLANGRMRLACAAGFCFGLVFLTKPEIFVALGFGTLVAFVFCCGTKKRFGFALKSLLGFAVSALLPVLGFFFYFLRFENTRASLRSVVFPWLAMLTNSIEKNPFYQWCLGLDTPAYNLGVMLIHFLIFSALATFYAVLFRRKTENASARIFLLLCVAPLMAAASAFDWVDCGRSLPLIVLVTGGALCWRYKQWAVEQSLVFPLLWSAFALALLAKLGLFSRIWHYGFALAMPAFACAIYFLLSLLPRLLAPYQVQARLFRGLAVAVLLIGFARLFVQSQFVYNNKTVAVGQGKDKLFAFAPAINPAGRAMVLALDWVEHNIAPQATLAVLPEGAVINFLSRRTNPTPYLAWHPPELEAFGQSNMVAAFVKNSPDYVMLIHRDSAEYGRKYFGQEARFGLELMQWISRHYQPVYLIGDEPLQNSSFGIKILKRLPAHS